MAQSFKCDVCGVERTVDEGAGQWFTCGINDYDVAGGGGRRKHLNIYFWPLGCKSFTDGAVKHVCSVTHMLEIAKTWALTPRSDRGFPMSAKPERAKPPKREKGEKNACCEFGKMNKPHKCAKQPGGSDDGYK